MTRRNSAARPIEAATDANGKTGTISAPPSVEGSGQDAEEWDDPSWRKASTRDDQPADALKGLASAEITGRHIKTLNELAEQTHPLASEYLMIAKGLAPDNPGRERMINMGCKLAKAVNQLITTSERLTKDRGG